MRRGGKERGDERRGGLTSGAELSRQGLSD